jgi:hypothetical protein
MRRLHFTILVLTVGGVLRAGQTPVNDTLARIRDEGMNRSQAQPVFETLAIDIGGRLTASPAHQRAVEYVRARLEAYGLSNVHLEPWDFPRGWSLEKLTVEMVEPRYLPLIAYADGWSASTAGEIVGAPLFVGGKSVPDLQAMAPQIKAAIVMTAPIMTNFVRKDRPQPADADYVPNSAAYATSAGRNGNAGRGGTAGRGGRGNQGPTIQEVLRDAGAGVLLKPSTGEHGTVFVTGRDGGATARPSVTIAAEQYNEIARLVARGVSVKLRVNVQTRFYDTGGVTNNVIAELPGVDPAVRDEIVMLGAHLDSWHTGNGATDNADGVATMAEAMRILKAVNAQPRRTIRVAFWAGEEQGLLGSRAWVAKHLAGDANQDARAKFDVYFNIDNGYGPIYGFYLENSDAARAIFDAWLEPLKAVGARRNIFEGVGSTDHLSFIEAGVPGFNPIQEYGDYDIRDHHTNMDTIERMNPADIREAAVVMASFAYRAAMAEQKLPRAAR